ncbi:MAG TPA: CheR family methyltransferase [Anaeromyxobacteraceae bacterium]|nr:CheR family methyltransferase [Anaeromyxobacteraceae bacterium]
MAALIEREVLGPDAQARLAAALTDACGIVLTAGQARNLPHAVRDAARARGVALAVFAELVWAGDEPATEELVARAVVGETCFLRHGDQLRALSAALPALSPRGAPLALWSAGCASGEEAYTLAMLLREAGRRGDGVLGTDVSEPALAQARTGRYGHWTLRRVDAERRARWFRPAGDELAVAPELRGDVEFRSHNLVRDPSPGPFDVVVCRNVLIYFAPEVAAEVARRLLAAVRPGGLLVLGPVELHLAASLPVEWVDGGGATLLRRPEAPTFGFDGHPAAEPSRPRPRPPEDGQGSSPASSPSHTLTSSRTPTPSSSPLFRAARHLFHVGALSEAERVARAAAEGEGGVETWLLLAQLAEARGEAELALAAAGRASALAPASPVAHAARAALLDELGRPALARLARADALRALAGISDDALLPAVEPVPAGALRRALAAPSDDA